MLKKAHNSKDEFVTLFDTIMEKYDLSLLTNNFTTENDELNSANASIDKLNDTYGKGLEFSIYDTSSIIILKIKVSAIIRKLRAEMNFLSSIKKLVTLTPEDDKLLTETFSISNKNIDSVAEAIDKIQIRIL
jgi:hypothetical protein